MPHAAGAMLAMLAMLMLTMASAAPMAARPIVDVVHTHGRALGAADAGATPPRTVHVIWDVDQSNAVSSSLPPQIINNRSARGTRNGGPGTGHGSAVNIYGNNGAFPSINAATGAVGNGGVPQLCNVSLHVATLRRDVAALVPNPSFHGVCLLDFEQLRADWNSTPSAQRTASVALAGNNDTALAQRQYEAAAKVLFLATIEALRALRPGCRVGWYGYPRNAPPHLLDAGFKALCRAHPEECTFDQGGTGNATAYTGPGAAAQRAINDSLDWLFAALDVVTPTVYLGIDSSEPGGDGDGGGGAANYVSSTVREAVRVARRAGKPAIAVVWLQYDSYYSGQGINKTAPRNLLLRGDLHTELALPLLNGASGLLIWGHADNSSSPNGVDAYRRYAETVLHPEITAICATYNCTQ